MGYKKPAREDEFVNAFASPEIKTLSKSPQDVELLMKFAREEVGTDPLKLAARLRMVFAGRAPTAFLLALMKRFYAERRNSG